MDKCKACGARFGYGKTWQSQWSDKLTCGCGQTHSSKVTSRLVRALLVVGLPTFLACTLPGQLHLEKVDFLTTTFGKFLTVAVVLLVTAFILSLLVPVFASFEKRT